MFHRWHQQHHRQQLITIVSKSASPLHLSNHYRHPRHHRWLDNTILSKFTVAVLSKLPSPSSKACHHHHHISDISPPSCSILVRVAVLAVLPDTKTARRRHHPAFRAARRPAGIARRRAGGSRAENITRTRVSPRRASRACGSGVKFYTAYIYIYI